MKTSLALAVVVCLVYGTLSAFAQEGGQATAPTAESDAASDATKATEDTVAEEPEEFDEQKFLIQFRTLLTTGEVEEASKQLKEAIEKHPESVRLPSLHVMAYSYLRSARRTEEAFHHLEAYVDNQLKATAKSGRNAESFARMLGMLVETGAELGGSDRAFAVLDDFTKRAKEMGQSAEGVLGAIDTQRALQLGKANRVDEAKALLEARMTAANEALAKAPDDANAILGKVAALKDRAQLEAVIEAGEADKAWTELLDFLHTQAKDHPDAAAVKQRFEAEHVGRAAMFVRTDPDAAEALLDRVESLTGEKEADAEPGTDDPAAAARRVILGGSQIARLRAQIADARKMLALVGSPAAYPENVDGWVNGEPLTPESLKGKVVLLDFFAVWCGPCIATFPHLREWHDEFSDKGLQIIGVTNYYQYGWDEEAARPMREPGVEPEAERTAMESFIKHHELRHTVAYVTDKSLAEHYVVNGIPHAVVIDRHGKVRLFRIGSGESNAADLEKAIKECLEESPPEA